MSILSFGKRPGRTSKIPLDIHRRVIDYPLENVQVEQVDFLSFLGERIFGYLLLPKTAGNSQ